MLKINYSMKKALFDLDRIFTTLRTLLLTCTSSAHSSNDQIGFYQSRVSGRGSGRQRGRQALICSFIAQGALHNQTYGGGGAGSKV